MKNLLLLLLFLLLILASCASWLLAYDRQVWWAEMVMVFILVGSGLATWRRFPLSLPSYAMVFLWCYLQVIGAQYTFERVPMEAINELFGFERNHYDRLAHFVVGLNALGIAEILWRRRVLPTLWLAAVGSVVCIMALANFWELVEWVYAEVDGGSAGLAFLGSQGDVWDAQKDMLMDTLGALLGSAAFLLLNRRKCLEA